MKKPITLDALEEQLRKAEATNLLRVAHIDGQRTLSPQSNLYRSYTIFFLDTTSYETVNKIEQLLQSYGMGTTRTIMPRMLIATVPVSHPLAIQHAQKHRIHNPT